MLPVARCEVFVILRLVGVAIAGPGLCTSGFGLVRCIGAVPCLIGPHRVQISKFVVIMFKYTDTACTLTRTSSCHA